MSLKCGYVANCCHFILLDYKLVIICSNENKEERSYIMEHLQLSHRDAAAVMAQDDIIDSFLKHHLSQNKTFVKKILASDIDRDK